MDEEAKKFYARCESAAGTVSGTLIIALANSWWITAMGVALAGFCVYKIIKGE